MTQLPKTVKEYSEYAAEKFLQTAVFVDDKIYDREGRSVTEPKNITSPSKRKPATRTAANENQTIPKPILDNQADDDQSDEYSLDNIVNSFAKKQIICSLYQPRKTAKVSSKSDIFKLCLAADIVILDWDIYGNIGDKITELIDGLIRQATLDVPEQLRLILVYTQQKNLFNVADQLYKNVSPDVRNELEPVAGEEGLVFHTTNSRVSVLGKTGTARSGVSPDRIVEEKELANVAVKEFAKLASGLLHGATLLGLAEIRKNSRKILSKFNAKLDPGFLMHRAMCLPEDNASSHIVPLLVSEIESVLEDALSESLSEPLISKPLIKDWCKNIWKPGNHLLNEYNQDMRLIGESFCLEGYGQVKKQIKNALKANNQSIIEKAAEILLPEKNDKSNHLFSRLMASRTFYGNDKPKILSLGSIVYCRQDEKYLLCIQPVCDNVRLEEYRAFVFVELQYADSFTKGGTSHIVVKDGHEFVELLYQPKSYHCRVATFAPNLKTKRVQSKRLRDGKIGFYDRSRRRHYHWIDQLKTPHAQRAVEKLARDLSRVGLTESEWSRLLAK